MYGTKTNFKWETIKPVQLYILLLFQALLRINNTEGILHDCHHI